MQAYRFAAALVAISVLSSACSSPSTTTTVPDRPTVAATQPLSTPQPPEPSPTATPAAPALEVLEWHAWAPTPAFESNTPNTFVEILVRNPYDHPVKVYGLAAQLLSDGQIVHQTRDIDLYLYADVGWNMILPGEAVPGQLCICLGYGVTEAPVWDSVSLSADIEPADVIAYTTELEIRTGPFRRNDRGNFFTQGTVTNLSGQPLRVILLRVIARDANGDFVGSGLTGVIGNFIGGKYESLEAGSAHEFSLTALTHAGLPDGLMFEVSGFGILAEP